jgi:hypothetical protein
MAMCVVKRGINTKATQSCMLIHSTQKGRQAGRAPTSTLTNTRVGKVETIDTWESRTRKTGQ